MSLPPPVGATSSRDSSGAGAGFAAIVDDSATAGLDVEGIAERSVGDPVTVTDNAESFPAGSGGRGGAGRVADAGDAFVLVVAGRVGAVSETGGRGGAGRVAVAGRTADGGLASAADTSFD